MASRNYAANEADLPEGTLTGLFLETVERFGGAPAYRHFVGGELEEISYRETRERVKEVAAALRARGLSRGDRAAILSENRPEWSQVDWGCLCAGVLDVPVHAPLPPEQIAYILKDAGARLVFLSDGEQLEKVREIRGECPELEGAVVFDPPQDLPSWGIGWEAFLREGREALEGEDDAAFQEEASRAEPHDVATILYTSGTTGRPKGVVLTHQNLFSNVVASSRILPLGPDDVTLSFLPLSHVFQRMADFLYFSRGVVIAYARSIETVADDLRTVRPTKVNSVPRLYEKVYQKVMDAGGVKGGLVRWASRVGAAHAEAQLAGRSPGFVLRLKYRLAHALVFKKIHQGVGGRLEFFVSGGAPLSPEINKFFYSAGIVILEGYGLTETSPVTNANTPERFKIGTVGPPIPGTEIRIADDGEILVRGPQVMKGYYQLPEETARVLTDDGWFHTGDVGELDEDGFLRITDRKKDILITAGGKNVAPQLIENRLKKNPYVDQPVMLGDRRKFLSLLVVPAFEKLEGWARDSGVRFSDRRELLSDVRVQELLQAQIFGELDGLASYEIPKKIGLLVEPFTVEGGGLTPTQKVKRRVVEERYHDLVELFYAEASKHRTIFVAGEE